MLKKLGIGVIQRIRNHDIIKYVFSWSIESFDDRSPIPAVNHNISSIFSGGEYKLCNIQLVFIFIQCEHVLRIDLLKRIHFKLYLIDFMSGIFSLGSSDKILSNCVFHIIDVQIPKNGREIL